MCILKFCGTPVLIASYDECLRVRNFLIGKCGDSYDDYTIEKEGDDCA